MGVELACGLEDSLLLFFGESCTQRFKRIFRLGCSEFCCGRWIEPESQVGICGILDGGLELRSDGTTLNKGWFGAIAIHIFEY